MSTFKMDFIMSFFGNFFAPADNTGCQRITRGIFSFDNIPLLIFLGYKNLSILEKLAEYAFSGFR